MKKLFDDWADIASYLNVSRRSNRINFCQTTLSWVVLPVSYYFCINKTQHLSPAPSLKILKVSECWWPKNWPTMMSEYFLTS